MLQLSFTIRKMCILEIVVVGIWFAFISTAGVRLGPAVVGGLATLS